MSIFMQLTQIEVWLPQLGILEHQRPVPILGLFELFFIVSPTSVLKIHQRKINHCFRVSLFCAFFIKLKCLVSVLLNSVSKLVASSQIIYRSCKPPFSSFLEPLSSLFIILHLVVKDRSESIHSFCVPFSSSFLVLPNCLSQIFVTCFPKVLVFTKLEKSFSAPTLKLSCSIVKTVSVLQVFYSLVSLLIPSSLHKLPKLK
jgi:hypothetical protein